MRSKTRAPSGPGQVVPVPGLVRSFPAAATAHMMLQPTKGLMRRTLPTPDLNDPPRRQMVLAALAAATSAIAMPAQARTRNPGQRPTAMSKLQTIQAFFAAYAAQDVAGVREVLAPDIRWTIPGHHPLSGTKHGVEEVLAFFDQLRKANFKAEPLVVAESGDYVIDHHRGWSDVAGGLDLTWCLVFRFDSGKIQEVVNFCADQHRADLFFWKVYPLKPIPGRLA